ncbi:MULTISPECIES: LysR family transcriptional regulator [Serratia]|jgi:DNA-binding transcriptional LysR family regulator|uniref:LysR family transcriptional regulator n=1 Tax=Serratia marcescens TaxID=615 RepID=A0A2V4FU30_SERMA|nr:MULTISPECIES: LysR family transcriptional regulator [Serratia]AUU08813.1 LysR family transcriptional regulator [Serratia marcescens]AVD62368.1 LysR family transcriptional regulator [Serratia marcescens]EJD6706491.1 LysR family transcriptional regulator [Serratia marcescens]ELL0332331.1 LysR family transcriptional regulator [Serratia marcescens]EMB6255537.1 LysR family transcriptional regulator [Serratia marcescens]
MESLGSLDVFVRVSESRSFTAAGQQLGISASAVSKTIARLEERLSVRLFHRSTRTVNLTPEGALFLERCRRILSEVKEAEAELLQTRGTPQGKLRISLPSLGTLFMPKLGDFKRRYPEIELDIDYSDRLVDVIEEGFDAVIRSGTPSDSRLVARRLGTCRKVFVGAPGYFSKAGMPSKPEDLTSHARLHYRFPSTGKLDVWPLGDKTEMIPERPASMVTNTLDPQVCFAEQGLGIAYLPEIAVRRQLEQGSLVTVLDEYDRENMVFHVLWPSGRHLSVKIRLFVDFVTSHLFPL